MATKRPNIKKIIEDRIVATDEELNNFAVGTKEHTLGTSDIVKLADAWAKVENAESQKRDLTEKRKEQKRVNDSDMSFKQTQLEIEATRAMSDKQFRSQQLKQDLLRLGVESAFAGLGQYAYGRRLGRVMDLEYKASGGANLFPSSNGLRRLLEEGKSKKVF